MQVAQVRESKDAWEAANLVPTDAFSVKGPQCSAWYYNCFFTKKDHLFTPNQHILGIDFIEG